MDDETTSDAALLARAREHEKVLKQIFPPHVIEALRLGQPVRPELFSGAHILFADVVGFTTICHEVSPLQAHCLLHDLYSVLDYCLSLFPSLYKVETIGDCLVVLGLAPINTECLIDDIVRFALLIAGTVPLTIKHPVTKEAISIRIGLHSGDIVGGVVGSTMPRYTFSGDSINVAARMQSLSRPNCVVASSASTLTFMAKYAGGRYEHGSAPVANASASEVQRGLDTGAKLHYPTITFTSTGMVDVKGKGEMCAYFVENEAYLPRPIPRRTPSEESLLGNISNNSLLLAGLGLEPPHPNRVSPRAAGANLPLRAHSSCEVLELLHPHVHLLDMLETATTATGLAAAALAQADIRACFLTPTSFDDDEEEESSCAPEEHAGSQASASSIGDEFTSEAGGRDGSDCPASPTLGLGHVGAGGLDSILGTFVASGSLQGLRVVVVEDSATQRKSICRQLRAVNPSWKVRFVLWL